MTGCRSQGVAGWPRFLRVGCPQCCCQCLGCGSSLGKVSTFVLPALVILSLKTHALFTIFLRIRCALKMPARPFFPLSKTISGCRHALVFLNHAHSGKKRLHLGCRKTSLQLAARPSRTPAVISIAGRTSNSTTLPLNVKAKQ